MIIGECDCCGKGPRVLHRCVAAGIDTAACAECGAGDAAEDAAELVDEIERLTMREPETAEQWAHICLLESAYVKMTGRQLPRFQA